MTWFPFNDLPTDNWAFDHEEIVTLAIKRLKAKVTYEPIGFHLLPEEFSMPQLQLLYEVILERELDKRNFVKKIQSYDFLIPTRTVSKGRGRPVQLLKFDHKKYQKLLERGIIFEL